MQHYIYMPQGIETLRKEMLTVRKQQFDRLCDQCKLYAQEALPAEHPMKSITYFAMAAANLCLAYKLTGQRSYLQEAKRWIFQAVAYPHWGRAVKVDVDLSAAWLLFGLGLCYNWIAEDLTPQEECALREKLILQGTRMYDYACTKTGSWPTNYWQNHNWIDHTGLAMAGYALRGVFAPAAQWTQRAKENFAAVFPLLPEDGSDYEGVAYWRYGVIWLAQYAQLLREQEQIDLFQTSEFLKHTFYYRLYQCAPDLAQTFNFGDCHDKRSGHTCALYYKIASEYQNGHAQWLAQEVAETMLWREGYESGIKPGILPEAFLEFLWYDPAIAAVPVDSLPKQALFEDLGLFSLRTAWSGDAQAFSYKCASGGGHKQWTLSAKLEREQGRKLRSMGHHHPDSNSFILINGNDYMVVDEGYSSKKMTAHHNVVLADGMGYEHEGTYDVHADLDAKRTAEIVDYATYDRYTYLRGEAAKVYHTDLAMEQCRREVLCAANGYYVVCDCLRAAKEHIYSMLLHFEQEPQISGNTAQVLNGRSRLQIYAAGGETAFRHTVTSVSANPTSQEPSLIITHDMQTLCTENKAPAKEFTFLTILAAQYQDKPPLHIEEKALAHGSAFCIKGADFTDFVIYNPEEARIEQPIEFGSDRIFVFTEQRWTVLSQSLDRGQVLQKSPDKSGL